MKTIFRVLLLAYFSIAPQYGLAVDESRLWLPVSYLGLLPELRKAAQTQEGFPACLKVIEGTLKIAKDSRTNPIFSIKCRMESGSSYISLVEAKTQKEIFSQRPSKAGGPSNKELRSFWKICKREVDRKTQVLNGRVMIKEHVEPEIIKAEREEEPDIYRFYVDLDAKGRAGNPLYYRATCDFKSRKDFSVKVGARR